MSISYRLEIDTDLPMKTFAARFFNLSLVQAIHESEHRILIDSDVFKASIELLSVEDGSVASCYGFEARIGIFFANVKMGWGINDGLTLILQLINRWLFTTSDDLVYIYGGGDTYLLRTAGKLIINHDPSLWREGDLDLITVSHEMKAIEIC